MECRLSRHTTEVARNALPVPLRQAGHARRHAPVDSATSALPGRPLRAKAAQEPAKQRLAPMQALPAQEGSPVGSVCCSGQGTAQATGVEFPEVTDFWVGDTCRSVGAGVRSKKIAFLGVKVYAVSLYVEAEKAAKELGVRARGGFFQADDDYTQALTDGAFTKVLLIELVRKVDGATFYEALDEALKPRMSLTGESGVLQQFGGFFRDKSLEKGTAIALLWRADGGLEVGLAAHGANWTQVQPGLRLSSVSLGRALFEVYLGGSSVVPEAKAAWAKGARALLDSETVRRQSRKSGA